MLLNYISGAKKIAYQCSVATPSECA